MSRLHRKPERITWPKDPTARAIQAVIAKWHIAGCLRLLRGEGHVLTLTAGGLSHPNNLPNNLQTLCETCNRRKQREDIAAAAQARGQS